MGRCEEFYEKWRREPNWCEKTPGGVSQIDSYLLLVDRLETKGIERSFTYRKLKEGAVQKYLSDKALDVECKDAIFLELVRILKKKQDYQKSMKEGDPEPEPFTSKDVQNIRNEMCPKEKKEEKKEEEEKQMPKPVAGQFICISCDKFKFPCRLYQPDFDDENGEMPSICPFGVTIVATEGKHKGKETPIYADFTLGGEPA